MVCIGLRSPQFAEGFFLSFFNETGRGGPEVIETPFSSTAEKCHLMAVHRYVILPDVFRFKMVLIGKPFFHSH